jgi:hypothetical protein
MFHSFFRKFIGEQTPERGISSLLAVICIAVLQACHDNASGSIEQRTSFRYNQHNPVTSLDPAFARTQNNIWAVDCLFNALVQLDDSLKVQPCLASNWDISADGLTYRFRLRRMSFFTMTYLFPTERAERWSHQMWFTVFSACLTIHGPSRAPGFSRAELPPIRPSQQWAIPSLF